MKKTTGLGLGLLAVAGGAALVGKVVNVRESKVTIAEQVIKEWAPIILEDLGLGNKEGILEKITVLDNVLPIPLHGEIKHDIMYTGFFKSRGSYARNSASIDIYAKNLGYLHISEGKKFINPIAFGKVYRRLVLFTLAHELRHFWQLVTGEYHRNSTIINGMNLVPYEMQWIEQDANKFAYKFVQQYKQQV